MNSLSTEYKILTTNGNYLDNIDSSYTRDLFLDDSSYSRLMSYASQREDEKGNYDYEKISNYGMLYLFIHLKGTNRNLNTKKDYIREILNLLSYSAAIGKSDIRDLSRSDIENFQDLMERKYEKTTTRAKKIGIVQSFLDWCYEEEYISKKLSRGLTTVKINKEEIPMREFDDEVLKNAIMYYNDQPKVKSLLLLLATTGLRLNEVRVPAWGALSFDSKRDRYYLRTLTKRGKIRYANIKDYVLEELVEYRKRLGLSSELDPTDQTPFYPNRYGKHYSLSSLSSSLSKKMDEASLTTTLNQRATPHYLRHFFAQTAYAAGAPISHIAETLGHTLDRTTKVNYLRNSLKKEHDVSEVVDIHLPKM
ncbi:hypothetical protein BSK63_17430 [Paenibacillus odorifer]|uniref:tyrosine-type recombinase/integrase n=1 Tax=Paenibacillus odorifer TaxID=189426 RepID=UPI00096FB8DD|nr:site-specific integrase [Paenibacillus odorifer]OME30675.1 hypothetical protein BSK63_17430 [Paenibacillus odorifer]